MSPGGLGMPDTQNSKAQSADRQCLSNQLLVCDVKTSGYRSNVQHILQPM